MLANRIAGPGLSPCGRDIVECMCLPEAAASEGLSAACRLHLLTRRAMPWLRGVACDSGSLAVGGRTKTQSQFQWAIQRQARYLVSTWRRSFFRGGDDLRVVVVHVVIVVMYVVAPVE